MLRFSQIYCNNKNKKQKQNANKTARKYIIQKQKKYVENLHMQTKILGRGKESEIRLQFDWVKVFNLVSES